MTALLWRLVESRLRRTMPGPRLDSILGDLAEDHAREVARRGRLRAGLWLVRETRSLERAYCSGDIDARVSARPLARALLADDFRQAWRRLLARPGSALLCATLLALGIGLATAMFSVVDSLMFRRAPFSDADQLVDMGFPYPEPDVMEAWSATGMFEAVEAVRPVPFRTNLSAAGTWVGAVVTPGIFELLGVRPLRGRLFEPGDARSGADNVVLVSETIWRSSLGADPDVIGRRVSLNDTQMVVVGIMPASFVFPTPVTTIWRPFDPGNDTGPRTGSTRVVGRIRSGVPKAEVEKRTGAISRELGRLPSNYLGALPLQTIGRPDELDDFTRRALWLLLAGVGLVFIVLCANVGSLLLAGLSGRRREFAVCTALGASRARLLRQTVIEHAGMAIAGAGSGVVLAWWITSIVPEFFLGRTLNPVDVDVRALAAASGLGIASVLLAGLLPAWLGTRSDPADAIRRSRHGGTDSRSARLTTRSLLVGQTALACTLLVGSVLLLRSFGNLVTADRGIDVDGVVQVAVSGVEDTVRASLSAIPVTAVHRQLLIDANAGITSTIEQQIAAWPEVHALALSRDLPPAPETGTVHFGAGRPAPARPRPAADASQAEVMAWMNSIRSVGTETDMYRVTPAFFEVYGIRLLRGRGLQRAGSELDVVIGERLASQLWPGQDPIGRTFTIGRTAGYSVIGVTAEIRLPTLDRDLDRPELYLGLGNSSTTLRLSLRCRTTCPDAAAMQSRLQSIHPSLRARTVTTVENSYLEQLRLPRAIAEVAGVFAVVALLTAAGGLFSMMTRAVGRRRREFGIRVALGAAPGQLRRLVLRDGLTLVAVGLAFGTVGAWVTARGLATLRYGVTIADAATWAAVLGTIAVTSLAASWRPARDAMRTDPVKLLREE